MKSCFGMLISLIILIAVIGAAVGIWYLSDTAEFERVEAPAR
ncbi:hypothetical protein ACFQY0_08630 [Haloferula chungangensis]|uniref:Uncharacterized protein n=1 Tax=Haloferula chungangensis TaxID=1048331 RepID=A0ABW2L676_9BACT